ncbi:GNAT family N-acetyltransferase [Catenuloplanes sp. NPDC051500]|uniref:GNAT family N-acetyltransferase n=1 Tax=Catenuloplanes sp. NPDC051500 TaxID=3363959 RepID=UPI00378E1DF6
MIIPVDAFYDALSLFCAVETEANGTVRVVSGIRLAMLNGVFSGAPVPDAAEIARLAADMPGDGPWSIQVRGEPSPEIVEIAAAHGLTTLVSVPMMLCAADAFRTQDARPGAVAARGAQTGEAARSDSPAVAVRRIGSADAEAYAHVLTTGFGAPRELLGPMLDPRILDLPKAATYLVEEDGRPVATGLGVLIRDVIAIFNITTVPERRRHGHGRLITETIMREAFGIGATRALLQSSADGLPLYSSMGFTTVESWTYLRS